MGLQGTNPSVITLSGLVLGTLGGYAMRPEVFLI